MTREEASKILRDMLPGPIVPPVHPGSQKQEAIRVAIAALRGPTREMVERMRGEWVFPIFADQQDANDPRCQCSECGSIEMPLARHRFCPACGSPMTDEAVDIRIKELEALHDKDVRL